MATLALGTKTYAVGPFKLRELRMAAPHIDRLAAQGDRLATVEAVADAAADMVAVIAVGIAGVTPDALLAEVGLADLDSVRATFETVLTEAGLQRAPTTAGGATPGEAQAGPAPDP